MLSEGKIGAALLSTATLFTRLYLIFLRLESGFSIGATTV